MTESSFDRKSTKSNWYLETDDVADESNTTHSIVRKSQNYNFSTDVYQKQND